MVLDGPVASGGIYSGGISIFTPGIPISKYKYKSKSTSKSSTPGVSMSGSPTPGIAMTMYVSILAMASAFPSSTPVLTSPLMVLEVSSLVREVWDWSSKVRYFSVFSSLVASYSTREITDTGMGTTGDCLWVMHFPIVSQRKV